MHVLLTFQFGRVCATVVLSPQLNHSVYSRANCCHHIVVGGCAFGALPANLCLWRLVPVTQSSRDQAGRDARRKLMGKWPKDDGPSPFV